MIAIVDHKLGNFGSIRNMLKKLGAEAMITSDVYTLRQADKLVLPGVGAFNSGMRNLRELGLIPVLNERVLQCRIPVLGICLGMQMMTRGSQEGTGGEGERGLGWIEAETVQLQLAPDADLRKPHMGWNYITPANAAHPLLQGLNCDTRFYFVHSFCVRCDDESNVLCRTDYGGEFTSAIVRDHIVGTQFHPEKSHRFGMRLMRNFVDAC